MLLYRLNLFCLHFYGKTIFIQISGCYVSAHVMSQQMLVNCCVVVLQYVNKVN